MRRPFPSCSVRTSLLGAVGFALVLLATTPSRGQDPAGTPAPLARYVPKDNILFYFEYNGLDAHADAWQKTAAYKILNNTPAGAMFEEVLAQIIDKVPKYGATPHRSGAELISLFKHFAKAGFIFATVVNPADPAKPYTIVVFRDAYKDKSIRPLIAKNLSELNAPNTKPQQTIRAGHKVITGVNATGTGFAWWVDDSKKEDIVLAMPKPEAADLFLETIDGKRPNAVENPLRAELMASENGFVPNGIFFFDMRALKYDKFPPALGLAEIKKLDFRFGFQDDALMTITRISAPSPHKGILALLDGPTFDKGKLPPIPETVSGFTVASLDLKSTYDTLIAFGKMAKPDIETTVNQTLDMLKTKPKLRLKEDLLGHLGPKVAWYVLPSKAAPTAMPSMLGAMMASAGIDSIPKLAIVFDLDDPKAFGKILDEVMAATNRELKNQAAKKVADAAPAGGAGAGGGGGGARNRPPAAPTFQFQLMPGDTKTYVMSVPPELSSQVPATLRPTIRVGPKHVVIAVSADVARLALEAKGSWATPNDLGLAFQKLSPKLKMLQVDDPRDTLPAILAAFPGKVQVGINTMMMSQAPGAIPPGGATPASPTPTAGVPGPRGAILGGPDGGGAQIGAGGPGGATPGPMTAGGPSSTPAGAGSSSVVIQVDAAKMPKADAIKALLFPSLYLVEILDDEIRIVSREAFPAIGDPSKAGLIFGLVKSKMMPAGPIMPPPGGVAPGTLPTPAGGTLPAPAGGTIPGPGGSTLPAPGTLKAPDRGSRTPN